MCIRDRSCPIGYSPVVVTHIRTRDSAAERAIRRRCLVFGPFGKRLVKFEGFHSGFGNLDRAGGRGRDCFRHHPKESPPGEGAAYASLVPYWPGTLTLPDYFDGVLASYEIPVSYTHLRAHETVLD